MKPFEVESHTPQSARRRLKQIGARAKRNLSTPETQVFFSGSSKVWVAAESDGAGGVELSFFHDCPCGGRA